MHLDVVLSWGTVKQPVLNNPSLYCSAVPYSFTVLNPSSSFDRNEQMSCGDVGHHGNSPQD